MAKKKDQQEEWESLAYRMDAEGFDYCFEGYSDWKSIEDEKFHELKEQYLKAAKKLRDYIGTKVDLEEY